MQVATVWASAQCARMRGRVRVWGGSQRAFWGALGAFWGWGGIGHGERLKRAHRGLQGLLWRSGRVGRRTAWSGAASGARVRLDRGAGSVTGADSVRGWTVKRGQTGAVWKGSKTG